MLLCDPPERVCQDWGLEIAPPEYFVTQARREQLEQVLARRQHAPKHGTVGASFTVGPETSRHVLERKPRSFVAPCVRPLQPGSEPST